MHQELKQRDRKRVKRALRVRKLLRAQNKPRLSIHKTNQHISAQLIDDQKQITICQAGTMSKEMRAKGKNKENAEKVGKAIAELAKANGVTEVVFDRGRFKFHGLVAQLANAARDGGLKF